jgi:predicted nucleotidyltransferase
MKIDELSKSLQKHRPFISQLGVKSLDVFGSVARGEAGPDSDIDLVVDFDPPPTFDRYMKLKCFLEDLFHCRIDLLTRQSMRPEMRSSIEQDARHVA